MPAANQTSYNSTSFVTVLDAILARLRARFTNGGYVRVVQNPETRLPEYKAEEGVSVWVRTPIPAPKTGGGRFAAVTFRDVVLLCVTQSLLDPAGEDEVAVRAHIAVEEAVANALNHVLPPGDTGANRIGTWIEWVEGGEDIVRQMKTDPGLLVSALVFRVQYVAPFTVYRGDAS